MSRVTIIPAFNEEKTIGEVIQGAKKYVNEVIVVDDGSDDRTKEIAKNLGVSVLRHILNRGLGAALRTGIEAALKSGADIIVTIDADGQHDPEDIPKIIAPIQGSQADVVIGSRMIPHPENWVRDRMPFIRRLYNLAASLITFLFFGIWTRDSQSGFRAFSRKAAQKIEIASNRMEVASEIIREIKRNNLILKEVPIKAIYTKYSLSKGQGFTTGLKTLFKLSLGKFIKE